MTEFLLTTWLVVGGWLGQADPQLGVSSGIQPFKWDNTKNLLRLVTDFSNSLQISIRADDQTSTTTGALLEVQASSTPGLYVNTGIHSSSTSQFENVKVWGNATTTDLGVERVVEFKELSAQQSTPSTDRGQVYVKDDAGDQGLYFLSELGTETLLAGAGSGGCTDLPCLTDVDDALAFTSGHYFRANGTLFTNSALLASDLSGQVAATNGGTSFSTYTTGDTIYASAANTLSKLAIGTANQVLKVVGGIPAWSSGILGLTEEKTRTGGWVNFGNNYPYAGDGTNPPTTTTMLTPKWYVDAVGDGRPPEPPVQAATTANLDLAGAETIDGYSAVAGNRILVKDQSTGSQNGCYIVVDPGAWTRCTDFDSDAEINQGDTFLVLNGTANGSEQWSLTTNDPITVDTTALSFVQISVSPTFVWDDGINESASEVDLDLRADRGLQITADQLDLNPNNSISLNSSGIAVATTSPFDWTALNTWLDARPATLNASTTAVGTLKAYGAADFDSTVDIGGTLTTNITGATQCLTANSAGVVSGTGVACGSGGGGGGVTNATSTSYISFISSAGGPSVWDNMPATTEGDFDADPQAYVIADLTSVNAYRIWSAQDVTSGAGGRFWLQYCIGTCTAAGTWVNATSTGINGRVATTPANTNTVTSLLYLPSAAKTQVTLRFRGAGSAGGTADPSWRELGIETFQLTTSPTSQAWQKYVSLANPTDIITPTTTGASIFIGGYATTTGGLTVDSGSLFVDADNNRVGILDLSPAQALTVGNGELFTVDSSGNASTTGYLQAGRGNAGVALSSGNLFVSNHATTTGHLHVGGIPGSTTNYLRVENTAGNRRLIIDGNILQTATANTGTIGTTVLQLQPGGGVVGIATTTAGGWFGELFSISNGGLFANGSATTTGGFYMTNASTNATRFSVTGAGNASTTGYLNVGVNNAGLTLGAGDLFVGRNATTTGSGHVTGNFHLGTASDVIFLDAGANVGHDIVVSTPDAGDDNFICMSGGGTCANTRGALVETVGNEFGSNLGGALVLAGGNVSTGDILFQTSGATQMWLDQDGDLGVGTTTPSYRLVVNSTSGTDDLFQVATTSNQSIFAITKTGNITLSSTSDTTISPLDTGNNFGRNLTITAGSNTCTLCTGGELNLNSGSSFKAGDININTASNFVSGTVNIQNENTGNLSVVDGGGYFGINTTTPKALLTINASNATDYPFSVSSTTRQSIFAMSPDGTMVFQNHRPGIQFTDTDTGDDDYFIATDETDNTLSIYTGTKGSSETQALSINTSARVIHEINTAVGADPVCWDAAGPSIHADCTSLLKWKTNVKDLTLGLNELLELQPRVFNWRRDPITGELDTTKLDPEFDLGFIAEEVEAVDPLLASHANGVLSGVKYERLTALLTNAVKELWSDVQTLWSWQETQDVQIAELKAQNAELIKRIEKLEKK